MLDGLTGQLSERQAHYLQRVKHNVDRLTRIINQLLDWSRLDVGRVDIKPGTVTHRCVSSAMSSKAFQTLAAESPLPWRSTVTDALTVRADRISSWSRFCGISSAMPSFTPQSGRVTVQCGTHDDILPRSSWRIRAAGLRQTSYPGLQRVLKVESAMPPARRNFGCSLPSLVTLHGGQMWVDSQLGVGTRFHVTLPLQKPRDYVTVGAFLLLSCGASCFAVSDSIMAALF